MNGCPVAGLRIGPETLDRSPPRHASGGTTWLSVTSFGRRTPSYVPKKKARLRTIGPPPEMPKLLASMSGLTGLPPASRGVNCVVALRLLFWLNQNAVP